MSRVPGPVRLLGVGAALGAVLLSGALPGVASAQPLPAATTADKVATSGAGVLELAYDDPAVAHDAGVHVDGAQGAPRLEAVVRVGDARVPIGVTPELMSLPSGTVVDYELTDAGTALVTASSPAPSRLGPTTGRISVTAIQAPDTERDLTVVPVAWADSNLTEVAAARDSMLAATPGADAYWSANSGGVYRVTGATATSTMTMAGPAPVTCDVQQLADMMDLGKAHAAAEGAPGDTVVLVYRKSDMDCGFVGRAFYQGYGIWMQWIPNNPLPDTVKVLAHELGHNVGLGHASLAKCLDGATVVTYTTTCGVTAYLHPYDVMGVGAGYLAAPHMARLNIIDVGSIARVTDTAPVTVTLATVGGGQGTRAVNVFSTVPGRDIWVEYRAATGLDAAIDDKIVWNGQANLKYPGSGVLVHTQGTGWGGDDAVVLNPQASLVGTGSPVGLPLQAGATLDLPGVATITVNSITASGASVTVQRAPDTLPPPALTSAPTVAWNGSAYVVGWTGPVDDSGVVARQEVVLDGQVVATLDGYQGGGTPDSYALPVRPTAGAHTVAVRVIDGSELSSTSPAASFTVSPLLAYGPVTLSVVTRSTVSSTRIPLTARWTQTSCATSTVVRSRLTTVTRGLKASGTDTAVLGFTPGLAGVATLTGTPCASDQPTPVTRSSASTVASFLSVPSTGWRGTWTTRTASNAIGGSERLTKVAGASATWKVSGRFAGWVSSRGPGMGRAKVYLDGAYVATVDLGWATGRLPPAIVWSRALTPGTHTVKVVNLATSGRPVIAVDAGLQVR